MPLNTPNRLLLSLVLVCLNACAPKSYVTLLENTDGSVGAVTVNGAAGETVIAKANTGAKLDGSAESFAVSQEQLQEDFGQALSARPELPDTYLLYFELTGMQLTSESQALIPKIKERIVQRKGVDVSIIGHSDTVGAEAMNAKLALKRAEFVKEMFDPKALNITEITLTSHGEKNLLVKTADEVKEPKNRRVEVTVR